MAGQVTDLITRVRTVGEIGYRKLMSSAARTFRKSSALS
jgi:hypothetical protein